MSFFSRIVVRIDVDLADVIADQKRLMRKRKMKIQFLTKIHRRKEHTRERDTKEMVVSLEFRCKGSGIRRADVKSSAAGKMVHNSTESGLRMAISSGLSGLQVKLTMWP